MSSIFSLIFYIAFAVYFLLGIYILWLNMKNRLNRIFFAACLSLSMWAFCFSVANSATDYETSLFWRRLASVGWGSVYSVLLHFIIVLTERKMLLKSKWLYVILYIPVLVNIYIFGLSGIARDYYDLVNTTGGWINVPVNTGWDLYFNIYYVSCSLIGLFLLGQWGRSKAEKKKRRQSRLLIITFAIGILLGTMTDIIVNAYMEISVPQRSPVVLLIPISAIFYSIKRYGLMGPSEKDHTAEPGKILDEVNHSKFFQIMSIVFMIGGMLNFVSQYFFNHEPIMPVMVFSIMLFAIGNILLIVQHIPKSQEIQDTVFVVLVSASIPLITLNFIKYASITVWAAPIIFLMLSVIFNKRKMMIWLGISILLTQICVWIMVPTATVQVSGTDYIVRIGIFSITLWLAFYVNRIYINRLEENEAQMNYLRMASHISADFVKVTESNLDVKINDLLEESGTCFQVDRCSLFIFGQDLKTMSFTHEWCNKGIQSDVNKIRELTQEESPAWLQKIINNEIVYIPDVELLPPEDSKVKEVLKQMKVQSMVSVPVMSKGEILGFICYESLKEIKIWGKEQQKILGILANLLADALIKVEAEKEISYMAYYDALTELPNRLLFKNRLEHSIHLAKRTETLIAVMFIDLDSFKSVNDSIGHVGGDELLKQVAARLSECVRKHDTVARFGGDEFLIKITQLSHVDDIRMIAEKILSTFNQPVIVKEQEFFISASMGIAIYPQDGEEAELLMKNADLAMYISKDKGKKQYTLCSPTIKDDVLRKMQLTNSLFRAQERNELVLYYQPQVNISTKEIIGFEALIRWNHPDLGMVSPGQFIPLAEKTGLINPIGQWVLETACIQNKKWQLMGLPRKRIAVNLSIEQFRNPNLVSMVANTLSNTGLDPKYLELEITESIAVEEADYVIKVLHELKDLGVTIAIDDFGTEYSSLSRLKALPVDRIKIAMQFVHGITEVSSKDKAIATIIIQLAKSLDLSVIAEGAETKAQVEFLDQQLCDEIQGFYYYKPMPAEELEKILSEKLI
ncbi:MAG: EAL domain-containing protein [Mobilitalea sp.]